MDKNSTTLNIKFNKKRNKIIFKLSFGLVWYITLELSACTQPPKLTNIPDLVTQGHLVSVFSL